MIDYIEGMLGSLKDEGYKIYRYTYSGTGVSTNQYYNAGHWTQRHKIKNKYKPILLDLIGNSLKGEFLDKFGLIIIFNSKHDTDNVVGFGKIFVDVLKDELEVITDDSKHYYQLCATVPDPTLPHNTFEFVLIDYGDY